MLNPITGVANAQVAMLSMLITELDKTGAISKEAFADLLTTTSASAQASAPAHLQGQERLDLKLMEMVAGHLRSPKPGGWTPVVIEGGKEE